VSQGSVKSAEAQVQLAKNALRDAVAMSPLAGVVAKRHVQVGEKVAFDSPLSHRRSTYPTWSCRPAGARSRRPRAFDRQDGRAHDRRLRRAPASPGASSGSIPAAEPGTRAILVYVGIPNADRALRGGMFATGRIALAASAPVPTLPATAIRTEAGQTYVWTVEGGKLVKRIVMTGRKDDATGPGRAQDCAGARTRRCSPRSSTT
jgi:multidrug efflux pump subunit AcrA (membrane-fusion protein)